MSDQYHYNIKGIKSFHSMDMKDHLFLKEHLKDYSKLSTQYGGTTKENQIKIDNLLSNRKFLSLITKYYIEHEIGIRSLVQLIDNIITPTAMRTLLIKIGLLRRQTNHQHIFTSKQKECRRYNALNGITPTSIVGMVNDNKHLFYNSNKQGIQGYYFSQQQNKNIWIRSTFEYIMIDYFEKNKIDYIYETYEYMLSDGRKYRPDFHLKDKNGNWTKVIEIKSDYYLSHQDDKANILAIDRPDLDIKLIIGIKQIYQYCNKECLLYERAKKDWKNLRKLDKDI